MRIVGRPRPKPMSRQPGRPTNRAAIGPADIRPVSAQALGLSKARGSGSKPLDRPNTAVISVAKNKRHRRGRHDRLIRSWVFGPPFMGGVATVERDDEGSGVIQANPETFMKLIFGELSGQGVGRGGAGEFGVSGRCWPEGRLRLPITGRQGIRQGPLWVEIHSAGGPTQPGITAASRSSFGKLR